MLADAVRRDGEGRPVCRGFCVFPASTISGRGIALGGALAPEQRPQTSPLFGVRLTAMLIRTVVFDLGVEPELVVTPAWTGYGFDGPRDSYFAPVFGYRGSLILRTRAPHALRFHALAGIGGATVVSKSPYMSTDTDPILYYGAGATLAVGDGWEMRLDGRQGFMPARAGGSTAIYEGMVGIGLRFGAVPAPAPRPVEHPPIVDVTPPPPVTPVPPPPPPDRDHDGVPDAIDKCPDQPEDKDGFQDEDGCPDLDNDSDGIPDAKDKCPNEPETKNGYQDEDGCPDQLPVALRCRVRDCDRRAVRAGPRAADRCGEEVAREGGRPSSTRTRRCTCSSSVIPTRKALPSRRSAPKP